MQITVIGDEFLQKFDCRYATEKLLDRLVFWSVPCLLLFALLSDQWGLVVLGEGSDTIESPPIGRY